MFDLLKRILHAKAATALRPVAGQMKDILTTGLGLFLFGDVKFDARNVTGVCIGLLGGIAYSLSSYFERQKPPRDAVWCPPSMYPMHCSTPSTSCKFMQIMCSVTLARGASAGARALESPGATPSAVAVACHPLPS